MVSSGVRQDLRAQLGADHQHARRVAEPRQPLMPAPYGRSGQGLDEAVLQVRQPLINPDIRRPRIVGGEVLGQVLVLVGDAEPDAQRQPDVVERSEPLLALRLAQPYLAAARRQRGQDRLRRGDLGRSAGSPRCSGGTRPRPPGRRGTRPAAAGRAPGRRASSAWLDRPSSASGRRPSPVSATSAAVLSALTSSAIWLTRLRITPAWACSKYAAAPPERAGTPRRLVPGSSSSPSSRLALKVPGHESWLTVAHRP